MLCYAGYMLLIVADFGGCFGARRVDVEPLETNIVPLEIQTRSVFELVNATARLGDAWARARFECPAGAG